MPDKYTYQGTEVLMNLLGIKDQTRLDLTEQNLASIGLAELRNTPLRGGIDFHHLRGIHRKLVSGLYEGAGIH